MVWYNGTNMFSTRIILMKWKNHRIHTITPLLIILLEWMVINGKLQTASMDVNEDISRDRSRFTSTRTRVGRRVKRETANGVFTHINISKRPGSVSLTPSVHKTQFRSDVGIYAKHDGRLAICHFLYNHRRHNCRRRHAGGPASLSTAVYRVFATVHVCTPRHFRWTIVEFRSVPGNMRVSRRRTSYQIPVENARNCAHSVGLSRSGLEQ